MFGTKSLKQTKSAADSVGDSLNLFLNNSVCKIGEHLFGILHKALLKFKCWEVKLLLPFSFSYFEALMCGILGKPLEPCELLFTSAVN